MSTFDDDTHKDIIASLTSFNNLESPSVIQSSALKYYTDAIASHKNEWRTKTIHSTEQIEFMARCTAYVQVFRLLVLPHGNSKSLNASSDPMFEVIISQIRCDYSKMLQNLPERFPIKGPQFLPESINSLYLYGAGVACYHMQPFTVLDLELFAFRSFNRKDMCLDCRGSSLVQYRNIISEPRRCYGLRSMETFIPISYHCSTCKRSFNTASVKWNDRKKWYERPHWWPLCSHKTAYSSELVNYVRKERLSTTTAGALAMKVSHYHMERYLHHKSTYQSTLDAEENRQESDRFGDINDLQGYKGLKNVPISVVQDIWNWLINNYLNKDAAIHTRSLYSNTTATLAFDATHRFGEKGKVVNSSNQRISPMKSLLVVVDNAGFVVSHALTTDKGNEQIKETLEGIAHRLNCAKVQRTLPDGTIPKGKDVIEVIGSDYAEKYEQMTASVFPKSRHQQDNFHFQQLLHYAVLNTQGNTQYKAVCQSIAIAIQSANSRAAMELNLEEVYGKYKQIRGTWSLLARQIFDTQILRIRKGYMDGYMGELDNRADTSRCELIFKILAPLMYGFDCGLNTWNTLITLKIQQININKAIKNEDPFMISTHGYPDPLYCNQIALQEKRLFPSCCIPVMQESVRSLEEFGVRESTAAKRKFGPPPARNDFDNLEQAAEPETEIAPAGIAQKYDYVQQVALLDMNLNPELRFVAEQSPTESKEISLPAPNTPPATPFEFVDRPHVPNTLTPTRSATILAEMSGLDIENFTLDGDSYHLFMKMRLHNAWTIKVTSWQEAQQLWAKEVWKLNRIPDNVSNGICGALTGYRISELLSWTVQDLFEDGIIRDTVTVKAEFMKNKKGSRTVVLHRIVKELLTRLVINTNETTRFIFKSREGINRAICSETAGRNIKVLCASVGIVGRIGTHSMRKTYAKLLYKASGNDLQAVQTALGHKNISTTIRYLEIESTRVDELMRVMW
jgi:hypothetical protein